MPAIIKGNQHMQAITYTGNSGTQTIYVGFKVDFLWFKSRSASGDNKVVDTVRGITKGLITNTTAAETTDSNGVTSITDTGFTLGSNSVYNTAGVTYVVWCWKAGQGVTSVNTNGSITSTVSVNQTAGFSIVNYTGTGANATIGHGLDVAPSFGIFKNRIDAVDWQVYHSTLGGTACSFLNTTGAASTSAGWWSNTPALPGVMTLGNSGYVNGSGKSIVGYLWSEIPGFSKFGSYSTNASADGPFVYTGFKPRWILLKASTTVSGGDWVLIDTSRNTFNPMNFFLFPNATTAESNYVNVADSLSNGFKIRATWDTINASGATILYAAFAENPFQYSMAR